MAAPGRPAGRAGPGRAGSSGSAVRAAGLLVSSTRARPRRSLDSRDVPPALTRPDRRRRRRRHPGPSRPGRSGRAPTRTSAANMSRWAWVARGSVRSTLGRSPTRACGRGQRLELRARSCGHLRGDQDGRATTVQRRDAEDVLDPEAVLVTARQQGRAGQMAELGDHGHRPFGHIHLIGESCHPDAVGGRGEEDGVVGEEIEAGPYQGHRRGRLAGAARTRDQHPLAPRAPVRRRATGTARSASSSRRGRWSAADGWPAPRHPAPSR